MSLLGRLEDLSLTDIIQIVFLSRRTGVLEIIDSAGRHTVLFRHGLIVNASAPDHLDLITYIEKHRGIPAQAANINLGNRRDRELIRTRTFRQKVAEAVYRGIVEFYTDSDRTTLQASGR